jgi:hypothetical protein
MLCLLKSSVVTTLVGASGTDDALIVMY